MPVVPIPQKQPAETPAALLVLWQSLVVEGYRGFFVKLAATTPLRIALVAPTEFRELANQLVSCAPFKPPFRSGDARLPYFILKAWQPHVQVVVFRGLRRALRGFFKGHGAKAGEARMFLCMAEPYSLTAIAAWVASRLALGQGTRLILFGLQNIYKDLPLPLRLVQKFMFRRSVAILSLGREQDAVLRRHGYAGKIIPFPLWFDAERFAPTSGGSAGLPVLGYAGGLTEAKGILDLLQCLETHAKAWAGSCLVRFAGAGPLSAVVAEACKKLSGLGLEASFAGPLSGEQMPAYFRGLDLLVVPSRTMPHWKEQFGRVIVEARATGVVTIGSDSGEIPHVVGGEERVFKERDPADMARIINLWLPRLSEPARRDQLRRAEAEAASIAYSDTALAKRFAVYLQELL